MKNILLILIALAFYKGGNASEIDWYKMSLRWDEKIPTPVDMAKRVLDAPAGKHGYINAVNDKLVFDDGTPARFWGVVLAVSGNLNSGTIPQDKKDAIIVAERIASYGFNHVRFVGLDGHAPESIKNWLSTGKVESRRLQQLDYFIYQLRKLGIYYSFSINNNSAQLFSNTDVIPENESEKYLYKRYRNTRMFHDGASDLMAEWIKALYSHKNMYTGLVYAQDPANIYVSAINEDTAHIVNFNKGRTLSDKWKKHINDMFNDFIHEKYKNQKDFIKAWSNKILPNLLPGESFQNKNIDLFSRLPFSVMPDQRTKDVAEFLNVRDILLTEKVKSALQGIGYKGLITGTNKWYGLGSLYTSYVAGNYIDGHNYFGGLTDIKREKRKLVKLGLQNKNYIKLMQDDADVVLDDTRFALSRILPAHLIDRPYISSEWNHMIWSDYAYQGPFIISSYASLNGIDGLNIHMLYNHPKPNYRDDYPRDFFNVSSNPLLISILPTLSLAYLRGDIDEYVNKIVYCYARNKQELEPIWHLRPHVPNNLKKVFKDNIFGSVRVAILDGCNSEKVDDPIVNDYAPVRLNESKDGEVSLDIHTDKYVASVGVLRSGNRVGPIQIKLSQPGSVSLISLDDKPLRISECALLTVSSVTRNTNMGISYNNGAKVLDGEGQWPPLLMGNKGTISIDTISDKEYTLVPVLNDELSSIEVKQDKGQVLMTLNHQKSPWYILSSNDCASAH